MLLAFDTATPFVTVALHDGTDVVVELVSERAMKHGEQLAPLIEAALRDSGVRRQDLTAIGVGVGPGPYTGLRVGLVTARTLGHVLRIPVHGVCTLDVLAVEAATTGTPGGRDFVVATDARRKEVYLARYAADGRRLEGPVVDKPATLATDAPAVGEGARLYPESFPTVVGPERPSAGWLARALTHEAAERLDPAPLYLRRPDAVAARRTQEGVVIRGARPDDTAAIVALEQENLGADAWSETLVAAGVAGSVPTVHYLVAEEDERVVGHAVASVVAETSELQRIAVAAPYRRRGLATALLAEVESLARAGGADALLLEVREDNAGALGFYADRGYAEIARRRRYYRDGATAVVLRR